MQTTEIVMNCVNESNSSSNKSKVLRILKLIKMTINMKFHIGSYKFHLFPLLVCISLSFFNPIYGFCCCCIYCVCKFYLPFKNTCIAYCRYCMMIICISFVCVSFQNEKTTIFSPSNGIQFIHIIRNIEMMRVYDCICMRITEFQQMRAQKIQTIKI